MWDIHFGLFENEFENSSISAFLVQTPLFVYLLEKAAFAATQNGGGQSGKFRWPPLGCLNLPKNNKQAAHAFAFGETVIHQKNGNKNSARVKKRILPGQKIPPL